MHGSHAPANATVEQRAVALRSRLRAQGITLNQWARERGYSPKLVHEILSGRRPCTRGNSHRIAVAVGIKDAPMPEAAE